MELPTYKGFPLSMIAATQPLSETNLVLWTWAAAADVLPGDLDTINRLVSEGYEQVEQGTGFDYSCLQSQCSDVVQVQDGDRLHLWARAEDVERVKHSPVALAFSMSEARAGVAEQTAELSVDLSGSGRIDYLLQFLPHYKLGEYAAVRAEGGKLAYYHISLLPERAQQLWRLFSAAIHTLAQPFDVWVSHDEMHAVCASEINYLHNVTDLRSRLLVGRGKQRTDIKHTLAMLEEAHNHVVLLRQSWLQPDWLYQWSEIRKMAQDLAAEYDGYHRRHTSTSRAKNNRLPALTSKHQAMLPSSNAFRGLQESFGPALTTHPLWQEGSEGHELATPNGSLLHVRGQEAFEQQALTTYLGGMIGPEGLKHLLVLMECYYSQTGAKERLIDAQVSLRQMLLRMGYDESKADSLEERQKLAHTILYLARTWVTSNETRWEEQEGPRGGKRPGRKRRGRGIEWTPLLMIEKMTASPDGGLNVPDEVKFHMGEDFYNSMFGPGGQFFYLPTLAVLSYHAKNDQEELCLSFYLTNMIFVDHKFSIHFRELALKSGLLTAGAMDQDKHRLRDAKRIIYALEHLERDGIAKRGVHEGLDTVLAVDFYTGTCKGEELAPATLKRIQKSYSYLQGSSPADLQAKRRKAMQRLLGAVSDYAITFGAGALMQKKVEHREAQRQQAIEGKERMVQARILKNSKIVDAKKG